MACAVVVALAAVTVTLAGHVIVGGCTSESKNIKIRIIKRMMMMQTKQKVVSADPRIDDVSFDVMTHEMRDSHLLPSIYLLNDVSALCRRNMSERGVHWETRESQIFRNYPRTQAFARCRPIGQRRCRSHLEIRK